jgi:hypothetical protein
MPPIAKTNKVFLKINAATSQLDDSQEERYRVVFLSTRSQLIVVLVLGV